MSTDDYDITAATGYVTPGRRRNNLVGSNTPTVADDLTYRWEIGSTWIFGSNAWIATDVAAGAAVWKLMTGAAAVASDLSSLHTDTSVSGAHTVDRDDGATHDLTLTGNATFTFAATATGERIDLALLLRQDGTGSRTVTWPGSVVWVNGTTPTLSTAASAVDHLGFLTVDDGTVWFGFPLDVASGISGIAVAEADGSPDVSTVTRIEFAGATVTNDGSGQVTVDASEHAHGYSGELLITDTPAGSPLIFDDLLQNEAGTDLLYEDAIP